MTPGSGLAEVNHTRLYYEVRGSGHPLILIHGFSLDHRMWDDQFQALSHHYRVIRYDARGFGMSDVPSGRRYLAVDDLQALMDYLGLPSAYLAGLSMGGGISIDMALTYPERVDALVLAASGLGGFEFSQEEVADMASVFAAAREHGIPAAKELWLENSLFAPAMEHPEAAAKLRRMIDGYSAWHFVNDDPAGMPDPPPVQRLGKVQAPALVLVGDRDTRSSLAIAGLLASDIPGARKVVLQGLGHMSNMEAPELFNETVLNFLGSL